MQVQMQQMGEGGDDFYILDYKGFITTLQEEL